MEKKYQVFISSTYEDLKEERTQLILSLLNNNFIPAGMEQFPASGMRQMAYIEKVMKNCDYFILILAGRYGSLNEEGVSYTEAEYDYAKSSGLPVLSFVIDKIEKLETAKCEQTTAGRKRLKTFREKVCEGSLVNFYSDIGDLKTKVISSLHQCVQDFPSIGWIRGNEFPLPQQQEKVLTESDISAIIKKRMGNINSISWGTKLPEHGEQGDLFFLLEPDPNTPE